MSGKISAANSISSYGCIIFNPFSGHSIKGREKTVDGDRCDDGKCDHGRYHDDKLCLMKRGTKWNRKKDSWLLLKC